MENQKPETETPQPPEVTGEQAGDPTIVGSLLPDEIARINYLKQQASEIQMELGMMARRHWVMNKKADQLEEAVHIVLKEAGVRLGVPDGKLFQVDERGVARVIPDELVQQMQGHQPPPEG